MSNLRKLAHLLNDNELAADLVAGGLDTPRKIKAEEDEDLEDLLGAEDAQVVIQRFKPGQLA